MNFAVRCFPHFEDGVEEVRIEDHGRTAHYYFPLKDSPGESFERELLLAYEAGKRDSQSEMFNRIRTLPVPRRER